SILRFVILIILYFFFFSSRRRHTRLQGDWSSDVCSSDLATGNLRLLPLKSLGKGVVAGNHVLLPVKHHAIERIRLNQRRKVGGRSEERRVGKECRSGWSR